MQTSEQITKLQRHKQKLLKKYLSTNDSNKQNTSSLESDGLLGNNKFAVKDNDEINSSENQLQQDSEQQSDSQIQNFRKNKRKRIQSSDEDQENHKSQHQSLKKKLLEQKLQRNRQQQNNSNNSILKSKKLKKKFQKAFGIENDEQLQDFLKQMKIQGMEIKQIKRLLKSKKVQLKIQANEQMQKLKKEKKKGKKQKKKEKKKKQNQSHINKGDQKRVKFEAMLQQSESSDIQIPEQARTIYRNKDGTVKTETLGQKKEKQKKQIYERLAQWETGMKKQDSDKQDDQDLTHAKNSVWDDPLKLWNQQNVVKPFQCKYQGPSNRFNIKPGCRWDGVIRGNGFQNKLIQQENLRKAKMNRQNKEYLKNL